MTATTLRTATINEAKHLVLRHDSNATFGYLVSFAAINVFNEVAGYFATESYATLEEAEIDFNGRIN